MSAEDYNNIREQRYRLFLDKGIGTAIQHSKTLVTIFSAIIAGLIAIVIYKDVGFWTGVMFIMADGFAVMGLGFCILHMSFTAKVFYLLADYYDVEQKVPDVVSEDPERLKSKEHSFKFHLTNAQRCYSNQLWFLFFSVGFAAVGVACLLWDQVNTTAQSYFRYKFAFAPL